MADIIEFEDRGKVNLAERAIIHTAGDYQYFACYGVGEHAEPFEMFYVLGMAGRGGAFVERIKDGMRGDYDLKNIPDGVKCALMTDLGYVLWNLTNFVSITSSGALGELMAELVCNPDADISLDDFHAMANKLFNVWENKTNSAALPRITLMFSRELGIVTGFTENWLMGEPCLDMAIIHISQLLKFITLLAHQLGFTLKDVMQVNADDLEKRRARKAISRGL